MPCIRLTVLVIDMHPLAVEDVLHFRKNSRSKTDYYYKHLFLRVLCHTVDHRDSSPPNTPSDDDLSRALPTAPIYSEPEEMDSNSTSKDDDAPDDEVWETTGPSASLFPSQDSTLRNTMRRRRPVFDVENTLPNLNFESGSPQSYSKVRAFAPAEVLIET